MVGKLVQPQWKSDPEANKNSVDSQDGRSGVWISNTSRTGYNQDGRKSRWSNMPSILLVVILVLMFLMVLLPWLDQIDLRTQTWLNKNLAPCQDQCSYEIVESIPEGLTYNSSVKHTSTFESWKKLIQIAQHTIEIGSFYWTLRKWDDFPNESKQGDEIFNDILNAGLNRNITVRITQGKATKSMPNTDTEYLILKKAAQVKTLDFDALIGAGVLHTKFWIVDRKHIYIGSANMDWRALTQVKELGIVMYNCSCVAEDLAKVFEVYWAAGNTTSLPSKWPDSLSTIYNSKNPFNLVLDGQKTLAYISSSPPQLSPKGRNDDLDALIQIIRKAKKFIHISVMDYLPLIMYSHDLKYWSVIDDELRQAVVERNVQVRLLTSKWPSTRPMEMNFLRSLLALNNFKKGAVLEVKLFKVPSDPSQSKIPYGRVNHNKYMVTDNGGFIGTSNWSGDYFISTAGVSLVSPATNGTSSVIQKQLEAIFERDWNSSYAQPLPLSPQ